VLLGRLLVDIEVKELLTNDEGVVGRESIRIVGLLRGGDRFMH
jgi:hypothetical protein